MFYLWVYAVVGSLYFSMWATGNDIVVRYAVGPMWVLMMAAPVVLAILVLSKLGILGLLQGK